MSGVTTASAIGMGLSATSAAVGAAGAIEQGQAASQAASYNAQIQANNAQIAQQNAAFAGQEGEEQAGESSLKTRSQEGAIKTSQAAGNIDVNTGSAVGVQASQASAGELDALTIRSNAAKKAYGFQTEAAGDTAQSQLDTSAAAQDQTAGDIKAGTTLLTSAANPNAPWANYLGTQGIGSAGGSPTSTPGDFGNTSTGINTDVNFNSSGFSNV